MNEFALVLVLMTAAQHQRALPVAQLKATVTPAVVVERQLTPAQLAERELLHKRMETLAPCLTGKLARQSDSPLFVPLMDEGCVQKALAAEKAGQ